MVNKFVCNSDYHSNRSMVAQMAEQAPQDQKVPSLNPASGSYEIMLHYCIVFYCNWAFQEEIKTGKKLNSRSELESCPTLNRELRYASGPV